MPAGPAARAFALADRARRWAEARGWIALALFWLAALDFCLRSLDLRNDQFGRISPGRQILVSGELPFRDFLDPGYFLTEYSSAAVQWLFGQNLLGEVLLDSLFIATGCLIVCLAARRLGAGLPASLLAGAFALLSMPRAYDYDKVLFYPLGLWLAFRWLERPSRARVMLLSAALVGAALYRYDNGVFLGLSVLGGAVALCWRAWRPFVRLALPLATAVTALCVPVLLFLQLTGGIGNAADQALTYGIREGARTRISHAPRVHLGRRLVVVTPPPPSQNYVRVRWASAALDPASRRPRAAGLGLVAERPVGPPENRTFLYALPDASRERVRQLVNDPLVEDTAGIDRGRLTLLEPEPRVLRLQRLSPLLRVQVLPDAATVENAEAVLYYLLLLLPAAAAALLVATRAGEPRLRRAQVTAVLVLCVMLDLFILRDPISARVGGLAGPFAVLGAALLVTARRVAPRGGRLVMLAVVLIAALTLAAVVGWPQQLSVPFANPGAVATRLASHAQTPPAIGLLPSSRMRGMVAYLRDCTMPADRVFVSWFAPELFYFAQRGFGGAMSATFGSHWSEPRFQRRSVAALEAQPTPVVIIENATYAEFRRDYPLLDAYITARYREAGVTDFDDPEAGPEAYRVMVRRDRPATRAAGPFALPCFAAPQPL